MNESNIDLILEHTYNNALHYYDSIMLNESSQIEALQAKRFITESVIKLRTMLVEEGIVDNVRENLLGYATAAGLGAGGLYLYNKYNEPNIYEKIKNGATDIKDGLNKDFNQPTTQEAIQPVNQATIPPVDPSVITDSTYYLPSNMNIFEESIAEVLPLVLETTSADLKSKLIARTILENGFINLEEAEFLCSIVDTLITEGAEEFIPDEIEVPEEDLEQNELPTELFDADGNKYIVSNGMIVPAGTENGEEAPEVDEVDPAAVEEEAGDTDGDGDSDAEEAPEEAPEVNESTKVSQKLITESSDIVARILAKMNR